MVCAYMWRSGLGKCSVVKRHGLGKKKAGVADSVLFSKQTFLVLAVQAPRRRGDGGIFLPEPELKKGASAAASVCLHHLFASCSTPTRRCRGPCTVRETLAQQGRKGACKGGAWEYLGLGPALGLLNVWGGKAPPRGTFAQSHWSWSGCGLKSPSHESWQSWPCVSLNAKSFFCLEGAAGPAKPPSVPALDCTDCRFFFSSALYKIL